MPFLVPIVFASITPVLLMTRIHHLTRRNGGQFDTAAVGLELAVVLHQRIERLAGRDVLHRRGDRVVDIQA